MIADHHHKQPELLLGRFIRHHPGDLPSRMAGDVAVALGVTAAVSPILAVIDKAIVQVSSGTTKSLVTSVLASASTMALRPAQFLASPTFLWMWMTYAATYSTANLLKTCGEHREYTALAHAQTRVTRSHASSTTTASSSASVLFLGTTLVNSGASLVKDRAYARLFGNAATTAVPKTSYALWMMRDLTVIGSSFVLPAYVTPLIVEYSGSNSNGNSSSITHDQASRLAQVGVPVAAQLVAGPLHYLGLDCYNRPSAAMTMSLAQRVQDRWQSLRLAMRQVVAARMLRVLPGYGIAGVYNTQLRNDWRDYLIERRVTNVMESVGSESKSVAELVALIRSKN